MMIPTRPTYHHGDLRNSLIRAALALVAERGVEGFSLREAARTVGVSASACYRHFSDREELLAAVAHEGLDTLAEEMRAAAAKHEGPGPFDAVQRFWDYATAYLHFAQEAIVHINDAAPLDAIRIDIEAGKATPFLRSQFVGIRLVDAQLLEPA